MGLNATKVAGNKPRTPPLEAGSYPARLIQVVDMGLQPRSYKGEDKDPAQEVSLSYELTDEFLLDEDGDEQSDKPRWVSETFPLFHLDSEKAKSTARYKVLDPKLAHGGDFAALVGTPVMVTVIQNPKADGKIYVNVAGISPMREKDAVKLPEQVNAPRIFDLDEPAMDVFDALPDWMRTRISTNLEFRGSILEAALAESEAEAKSETAEEAIAVAGTTEVSVNENPY